MMTSEVSPINVVAALRQSRKGKISYDRHWTDRNSSVERVLNEVTCKSEATSEKTNSKVDSAQKNSSKNDSPSIPNTSSPIAGVKTGSSSKKMPLKDSLAILSPLVRSGEKKPSSSYSPSPVIQ